MEEKLKTYKTWIIVLLLVIGVGSGIWIYSNFIQKPPTPEPSPQEDKNCDPNYSPCIPNVSHDLDCSDIGFTVKVTGVDRHKLDRDKDGLGCE